MKEGQQHVTNIKPPFTLMQLAGVQPPVARLSDAVLLIIDAQREYVDGQLPLVDIEASLSQGGVLLARARAAQTPVVFVLHRGAGALFNAQGTGFEPAAPLLPLAGEAVVEKIQANAFFQTNLLETLTGFGRKQLIVIGYMTHNCVSSTVRAARDLGYACTIVAAATATRNLPGQNGEAIPAAVVQSAVLAGLSDTIATVITSIDEVPA